MKILKIDHCYECSRSYSVMGARHCKDVPGYNCPRFYIPDWCPLPDAPAEIIPDDERYNPDNDHG